MSKLGEHYSASPIAPASCVSLRYVAVPLFYLESCHDEKDGKGWSPGRFALKYRYLGTQGLYRRFMPQILVAYLEFSS